MAARERKNEKINIEKSAKQKAEEDAYWQDDNKLLGMIKGARKKKCFLSGRDVTCSLSK